MYIYIYMYINTIYIYIYVYLGACVCVYSVLYRHHLCGTAFQPTTTATPTGNPPHYPQNLGFRKSFQVSSYKSPPCGWSSLMLEHVRTHSNQEKTRIVGC